MSQFNKLTDKEHEALTLLFEECSEVVQIVGKILRHGLESYHPKGGESNRCELVKECGDVMASIQITIREGIMTHSEIEIAVKEKIRRCREHPEYLHHLDPL